MRTAICLRVWLFLLISGLPISASANEPCLLAYPLERSTFFYDPSRYEIVSPSSPLYDPQYALGDQMLWDAQLGRVAFEVYQAPGLVGFEESVTGRNEFNIIGDVMTLIVDGFSDFPRQLSDVYVLFRPVPIAGTVVYVNDVRVEGLRHLMPRMSVSTPTTTGHYSDTVSLDIRCRGAIRLETIVFSDRNGNRVFDGEPCFSVMMESFTVPTAETTWGGIKALYRTP